MARKKREGISTMTRFEVFKRDGFVCSYCGGHPPTVILHVDHIVAVAKGGGSDMDNLTTSCDRCNLGKGARDIQIAPQPLSERATLTAEKEAQLRGYGEIMESRRQLIEDEAWEVALIVDPRAAESFRKDWLQSIKKFLGRMPVHMVKEAADIAGAKGIYSDYKRFSYFCGVCWNMIREAEGSN